MPVGLQGVEALSERQKEILRLVAKHYQAKEIARLLNISEHTVKTHTDEARRRLDVSTSRQAARILVDYEGGTGLPLEEPPPRMGMPDAPLRLSVSGHEQALSTPQSISDHQLPGTGGSLGNAGSSQQIWRHQGFGGSRSGTEHDVQSNEGIAYNVSRHGLVSGRWDEFRRRLKSLPAIQLLGLIVLAAIALAFIAGMMAGTLLGMVEVVHKLTIYAGWK
jgi:DNA-binding CsgD family transcriptional regulator